MGDTVPKFKIGDRVRLKFQYEPENDSWNETDEGDEGFVYGLAWNNGRRWFWESQWVYWIRFDRHKQPWLGYPFWDPDPIPEEEISQIAKL